MWPRLPLSQPLYANSGKLTGSSRSQRDCKGARLQREPNWMLRQLGGLGYASDGHSFLTFLK